MTSEGFNEYIDNNKYPSFNYYSGRNEYAINYFSSISSCEQENIFELDFSDAKTAEYQLADFKNGNYRMINLSSSMVKVAQDTVIEATLDTSKGVNYDNLNFI